MKQGSTPDVSLCPDVNRRQNMYERVLLFVVLSFFSKEWNKHWFVLRGSALLFYRDPTAEDQGILDGVVDLSCVTAVGEVQVNRNYGFQTIVST